ncbi:MAG TPA: dihydrofolate reductase family protein [Thermomicrobiales bacterium]|nr:dihydrofolate reductase family protein [Thermomicrobiales bacterium]
MRRITAIEHVTLDGVMQAPGRPDEDTRGGFTHGGWAGPYMDEVMAREMGRGREEASGSAAMLFGRRTYEDFFSVWPKQVDSPFSAFFNGVHKLVVSTTLAEPLPWVRSTLLAGDAVKTVGALKATDGPDLNILGSGELVRSLHRAGLIDAFVLSIIPLTLGSGQTLFAPGERNDHMARLTLVRSVPTTTGVIIATYEVNRAG